MSETADPVLLIPDANDNEPLLPQNPIAIPGANTNSMNVNGTDSAPSAVIISPPRRISITDISPMNANRGLLRRLSATAFLGKEPMDDNVVHPSNAIPPPPTTNEAGNVSTPNDVAVIVDVGHVPTPMT